MAKRVGSKAGKLCRVHDVVERKGFRGGMKGGSRPIGVGEADDGVAGGIGAISLRRASVSAESTCVSRCVSAMVASGVLLSTCVASERDWMGHRWCRCRLRPLQSCRAGAEALEVAMVRLSDASRNGC